MLHNRIARELRAHFSTVGPSPRQSASSSPQHGPIAPTSSQLPPESIGPRLVVTNSGAPPPAPPGVPSPAPILPDLLAVTAHRCSAFFAEAAVLVLVLGILDRLLSRGHLERLWILGVFASTLGLLAASVLTDVSARRWLRAH